MANDSVLRRTARGAGWTVAWRMSTRLMGLVSTLILIRLLAPEDFGLVALATAIIFSLDVCLSFGPEDQIIRAKDPTRAMYDTAFTLNVIKSLLVGVVLYPTSDSVARFFGDARLGPLIDVLCIYVAVAGFMNVGVVDFRRNLRFDKEFQLQISSRVFGIVVGVTAAFVLRSYWALVVGIMANRAAAIVLSYALHPYRPRLSLAMWRELLSVSVWTWGQNIAYTARDRVDTFVVGRVLGPIGVGHYSVGWEIATLPQTELIDPVCRACMPGFAEIRRNSPEHAGSHFRRIIGFIAVISFPAAVGISALAAPVVALAFGRGWEQVAPVIAILAVLCIPALIGGVSGALLAGVGMLRTQLALIVVGFLVRVVLLLLLTPSFGLVGAALASTLGATTEFALNTLSACRSLRVSLSAMLGDLWRPAVATAIMGVGLLAAGLGWAEVPSSPIDAIQVMVLGIMLGAVTYAGSLALLWALSGKPRACSEYEFVSHFRSSLGTMCRRATGRWS